MPTYRITDPKTQRTLKVTGDSPPTAAELEQLFASAGDQPERGPLGQAFDTAVDVGKGALKGAGRTGIDLAKMAMGAQVIPGLSLAGVPVLERAREGLTYDNTAQRIGGGLETAAEFAFPLLKGAQAVPTAAKAGAKFQSVMGAAKNVPVDIEAPGQVALRVQQMAERGGAMPLAVRKFLNRVTDPNKGELTYEEARDFASNLSRLSADETRRLAPAMRRELANLRVSLNESVGKAAESAGKGAEYKSAMSEYAQAMRIKDAMESFVAGAKKAAPYATAAGVGTWAATKIQRMLSGGGE